MTQAIEELKQVQQKLIETEKMGSLGRITMGLSHQLNTPIGTSISLVSFLQKKQNGFLGELQEGSLSKEGLITYVEEIGEAVDLVEQELNWTKNFIDHFKEISSNGYPQDVKEIHMKAYLENVIGIYKNHLESQKVSVVLVCDENLVINTSVVYLNNIFRSLISNSLKHGFIDTECGEIYVSVIFEDSDIIITYKDNGVGIERNIMNSICEPLFTISMGKSPGMGLSILYNTVVKSLGGTLDLSSEYGMGVNFVIRFTQ